MKNKEGDERKRLIPRHGGYHRLKSFQVAQLVYEVTARLCERYVDRKSRTHVQMVQAALSGVQNIAEGQRGQRHIEENPKKIYSRKDAKPQRKTAIQTG